MNQMDIALKEHEEIKRFKEEKAKRDIVGAIFTSDIMDILGFSADTADTADMLTAWKAIDDYCKNNIEKKAANDISELIVNLGISQEERGFKQGFHIATRLFVEGMRGGAY